MNYFWAFVVGGGICVIGQLLIDLTGLTPARILTGYVVAGASSRRRGGTGRWRSSQAAGLPVPLLGVRGICWPRGVRTPSRRRGPSASSPEG